MLSSLVQLLVSTHSRAEAAAISRFRYIPRASGFNTQPRGGGCKGYLPRQPGRVVSTHSRAEAAANLKGVLFLKFSVSTHSRAEAAAGSKIAPQCNPSCFNTQPRGGGCRASLSEKLERLEFQHTAARRRLQTV